MNVIIQFYYTAVNPDPTIRLENSQSVVLSDSRKSQHAEIRVCQTDFSVNGSESVYLHYTGIKRNQPHVEARRFSVHPLVTNIS